MRIAIYTAQLAIRLIHPPIPGAGVVIVSIVVLSSCRVAKTRSHMPPSSPLKTRNRCAYPEKKMRRSCACLFGSWLSIILRSENFVLFCFFFFCSVEPSTPMGPHCTV
ncbi:hypothetical protein BGZ63DRAFT_65151 [Mariannaea sp. PMI_226]|nr:hypothetical protein BGZ63DRAFT_65151 [Mariannaea sp. PMI_226]